VAPPSAQIVSTPAGWVNQAHDAARVGWQAADNFGSDGITGQRVQVAGETRWAGAPGQGQHAADVSLAGIPDGTHRVRVEVDGDGTAGAAAESTIRVDRTPPDLGEVDAEYPPGATRGLVAFSTTDATSGLNLAILGGTGTIDLGSRLTIAGLPGTPEPTLRIAQTQGGQVVFGLAVGKFDATLPLFGTHRGGPRKLLQAARQQTSVPLDRMDESGEDKSAARSATDRRIAEDPAILQS
jgi:hypothetical protein